MTSRAPSPAPPLCPATRVRVRWENVMIVLIGVVVASFAVMGILISQAPESSTSAPGSEPARKIPAPSAPFEDSVPASTLTLDDSLGLVEEARSLAGEARWDEATDRLDAVPAEYVTESGADTLRVELEATRAQHDRLRAEIVAAVEARRWDDADRLLVQIAGIATLDAELLALQAAVERGAAPAPTTPRASAAEPERETAPSAAPESTRPAPAATGGGGTATRPRPAANPRPAAPAATAPSGGAPAASTPAPQPSPTAPIALTPQQEAELAAALGIPNGDLQ
jgi:hypothetical protein